MSKELKMIPCHVCKEPMPELRLTKFGYKFCVKCSSTEKKLGIEIQLGEGDHTYNETIIL